MFLSAIECEKTATAETFAHQVRAELTEANAVIEQEKRRSFDISIDLTRQYKSMRDDLNREIVAMQNALNLQHQHYALTQQTHANKVRILNETIAEKESAIAAEQRRSERLVAEFELMLKETAKKMADKIEVTNDWESDRKDELNVRTIDTFALS